MTFYIYCHYVYLDLTFFIYLNNGNVDSENILTLPWIFHSCHFYLNLFSLTNANVNLNGCYL